MGCHSDQPLLIWGSPASPRPPGGTRIRVRGPLADHDRPIVRTYLEVEDMARAVQEAETAGAVFAHPPTQQGATGT